MKSRRRDPAKDPDQQPQPPAGERAWPRGRKPADGRKSSFTQARTELAAIVESSDDAILSKDLNGIVQSWNKGAERIYGYSAEEMVGSPVSRLVPAGQPDDTKQIMQRLRRGQRLEHYET